jgi:HJR/Mrr/RecB family endonuclease
MSALNNLFERAVMGLVTRVSGRTVVVLAALLYPGVGLILPVALGWSTPYLVEANVLGTMFAGVLSLGWLSAQIEAARRRHLLEWTTDLRHLNAEEFEWLVGETYRREGWKIEETGHQDAPDGNIDLVLTRDRERKIIQCKRWESRNVGVDEIRGFAGTLLREGLPATAGIFVTLSDFTQQARTEARTTRLTLLDGRDLFSKVEKARRPEPCPICQRPMRFDRSQHGWWLRCVAPGCSGKHDLGIDPGRAVEFLTEPPRTARI